MFDWIKYKVGLNPDHGAIDQERLKSAIDTFAMVEERVNALTASLSKDSVVVNPKANDYESTRRVCFNLQDAGYPVAIIKPKTTDDVSKIVVFMGEELSEVPLAVKCGAHTGFSIVDNAIVLDLVEINDVSINKEAKLVTVGGGCKIQLVDKALEGTGLGFVTGTNGSTGVSGLTLAGGFGFLSGLHGFACDNVVKATVILPTGKIIEVSDDGEYSDLMRALRGGGGNFGIVVSWTFKLHDVTACFGGLSVKLAPTEAASIASLIKWTNVIHTTPNYAAAGAVLPGRAPVNVYLGCTYQDEAKTATSWKELDGLNYISDLGGWMEMENNLKKRDHCSDMQKLLEPMAQPCYAFAAAVGLADIDAELAGKIVSLARSQAPTKDCLMIIFKMGGEGMNEELSKKSVLGHRLSKYWMIYDGGYTQYSSKSTVESVKAWMHKVKTTMMESSGSDLPYAMWGTNHKPANSAEHQAYNAVNKAYMRRIKSKYDPSNFYSLNKNVEPE